MRNDFTSQVETRELADSDLDNIAGGFASAGAYAAGYGVGVNVGDVVGTVESVLPVSQVTHLAGQVTGLATVQTAGLGL